MYRLRSTDTNGISQCSPKVLKSEQKSPETKVYQPITGCDTNVTM